MYSAQVFLIDWDKVKTVDDIKRILMTIAPVFDPYEADVTLIKDLVTLHDRPPLKPTFD